MSTGNDQGQNQTSGSRAMEGSDRTPADRPSNDSSPQGKTDRQSQDENNSNGSSLTEKQSSDLTVKPDEPPRDVANDADGGTDCPKMTSDVPRDQSKSVPDSLPSEEVNKEGDSQPIIQPQTVELPPLDQTVLPQTVELPPLEQTKLAQTEGSAENVGDGGSNAASRRVNSPQLDQTRVELPPLDQTRVELPPLDTTEATKAEEPPVDKAEAAKDKLPPLDQQGASSEASASSSGAKDENSGQSVYYIKWIQYKQNKVPIITQNENGPCPLLAIMNVLLLKGKVKLAPVIEMITSEQLMTYLGECILDSMPENLSESVRANYEQNMQDAMSVMYKLQTGLDVNVKFTGVADFEYTPECIIFDLLGIPLYHGWLVDPQDLVCTSAVGTCSYNQLVEKIIAQKSSEKEEDVTEALVAEQFLDRTASQLTYYGLLELSTTVKEGELCVFFRNNHFSTLFRVDNELFILVTDQGFLTETNVVWETLSNVEGDCHFVDTNFRTYTKPEPTGNIASSPVPVGSDQQIDQDYQVALSLQQDAELREEQETAWGQLTQESSALQMADHELARRLQEEEDRRAAAAVNASQQRAAQQQQGQGQPQGQGHGGQGNPQPPAAHSSNSRSRGERDRDRERERHREEKKEKDCTIL